MTRHDLMTITLNLTAYDARPRSIPLTPGIDRAWNHQSSPLATASKTPVTKVNLPKLISLAQSLMLLENPKRRKINESNAPSHPPDGAGATPLHSPGREWTGTPTGRR